MQTFQPINIAAALLSASLILFSGCNDYDDALAQANKQEADINAGLTVFTSHNCAACHGDDAGTSALGISRIIAAIDTPRDIENALFTLKAAEADREAIMQQQAQSLSTQEILDVAAYIASLR